MITRKIMAEIEVTNFKRNRTDLIQDMPNENLVHYVGQSTNLGIALEELGVITKDSYPEEYEYLSSREGYAYVYYDKKNNKMHILSFRELLNLLPETLDNDEQD